MRRQAIFHRIHWTSRRGFVLSCISTPGEHGTRFFVCSEANDIVEWKFKTEWFKMCVDFTIKGGSKPSMNSQLFTQYILTGLLL
jgi:hypothetical protein